MQSGIIFYPLEVLLGKACRWDSLALITQPSLEDKEVHLVLGSENSH